MSRVRGGGRGWCRSRPTDPDVSGGAEAACDGSRSVTSAAAAAAQGLGPRGDSNRAEPLLRRLERRWARPTVEVRREG